MKARGRHLEEMQAAEFLASVPPIVVASLAAQGFVLRPTTRPYVSRDGSVQVRLVWRAKCQSDTCVLNIRLRGKVPEKLVIAIDQIFAPKPAAAHA